ncbi:hypothetical protein ACFL1M_03875 [Patescibacteria group bacterium]
MGNPETNGNGIGLDQVSYFMENVNLQKISSGATVDWERIEHVLVHEMNITMDNSRGMSIGSGLGLKPLRQTAELGIPVDCLEINPNALLQSINLFNQLKIPLKMPHVYFFADDITRRADEVDLKPQPYTMNENEATGVLGEMLRAGEATLNGEFLSQNIVKKEKVYDFMIAEALFCNVVGRSPLDRAIRNVGRMLKPGGRLFVADCIDARDEHLVRPMLRREGMGYEKVEEYVRDWQERYNNNVELGKLLGKRVDSGTFVVMEPGVGKEQELAKAKVLKYLYDEKKVERWARHFRMEYFRQKMTNNGLSICEFEPIVWRSRTGLPIAGFRAEFEKV